MREGGIGYSVENRKLGRMLVQFSRSSLTLWPAMRYGLMGLARSLYISILRMAVVRRESRTKVTGRSEPEAQMGFDGPREWKGEDESRI